MKHLHNDSDVVCISSDATLRDAATILRERGIGCLVVTDAEGRATGIVTDRDICLRAVAWERDPDRTRVSAVMTADLRGAPAGSSHAEWAEPMRRLGVRRVPLLDDAQRPVGLASSDDWLRWIAARLVDVSTTADPAQRHGPLRSPKVLLDELERHVDERQLLDRDELFVAIARLRESVEPRTP